MEIKDSVKPLGTAVDGLVRDLGKGERVGIPSGFTSHDSTVGTFLPGTLNLVAARPGMGKTAYLLSMAVHQATLGIKTLFFSLEIDSSQVAARVLAMKTGISLMRLLRRDLTPDEARSIVDILPGVHSIPMDLDDETIHLRDLCELIKRRVEAGPQTCVYIDYIGLVSVKGMDSDRYELIGTVTRTLKLLAKKLRVPFIVACQLNRRSEYRNSKEPVLSDLRESGELENHSDTVLGLYRPAYYFENGEDSEQSDSRLLYVYVLKNRHGPTGRYSLDWDGISAAIKDRQIA
jgi:replicative DNA helicase